MSVPSFAGIAALLWACLAHFQSPAVRLIPALRPEFLPLHPRGFLGAVMTSGGLLVVAVAVLGGWWVWGRRVAGWLGRGSRAWPFELAAGMMAGSLVLAGLGFTGLFFRPVLGLLLAVVVAAAWRMRAWRPVVRWVAAARWETAWPGVCLLPAVPWIVVAPLLPVTDVDMLEYHAGLPTLWLMVHRLHNETGNLLFTMPLGFERLSVPFVAFGLGGAVVWTQLLLVAAAAVAFAAALRSSGDTTAVLGGWLVLGFGAALRLGGEGHPDTGLVFAAALGALAAARGRALETGLTCALAAFTKYQGIALAAAILVSTARWSGGPRRRIRWGAVALGIAAIPSLPWLLRNWWLTGNPVYPFWSRVLPSLAWTDWNTEVLWGSMPNASVGLEPGSPGERVAALALVGWNATKSVWFNPAIALLYACPLVLLARRVPPVARRLAAQALVFGLVWLVPVPKFGRYLVPGLVPALGAWWLLAAPSRAAAPVLALLLAVESLIFVVEVRDLTVRPERMLAGGATAGEIRRGALGPYADAVEWINAHPAPGRTLIVGHGYGLGLAHPWLASNETGKPAWLTAAGEAPDPVRMRARLRQAGVTRVLYNPVRAYHRHTYALGYALSEAWLTAWADLWRRWALPERTPDRFDRTGGWWVYGLAARPGPSRPQAWLPGAERLWIDESDLRRGEADPVRLALQRRVAGDFGMAWFQRSMLSFHGLHEANRAIREVGEAERRGLLMPGVRNALGVYLEAAGRRAEAARRFREALALDPGYATARANLAEVVAPPATAAR